jgi:hypothetical protein
MGLKLQPETSKNAKSFVTFLWNGKRKDTPDKIESQYFEDIINPCSQLHIGFAIQ